MKLKLINLSSETHHQNIIEESAIKLLQDLGWQYANGSDISPCGLYNEQKVFLNQNSLIVPRLKC
ncbi:MAG: hypothetical protein IAE65_01100 [Ignavibacteria bacterium]|nr:hypothetical protein [Ignavibacteria bacterium]